MAGALCALLGSFMVFRAASDSPFSNRWMVPAFLAIAFFRLAAFASAQESPTGFWSEHTRNLRGNHIWFDLFSRLALQGPCCCPAQRTLIC